MWQLKAVFILLIFMSSPSPSFQSKCSTCEGIVDKFKEGLKKTAKSNFGGGNTHWEEKKLGSYAFSETRLLEILEDACSSTECHTMLEQHEEVIENWWFKYYAKKKDTELRTYLCVERVKGGCCEKGKWGPKCSDCPGGQSNPCKGTGTCDGDGTKDGTGKCTCNEGYTGDLCDQCSEDYFEESKDETHTICSACHVSCKGGCSGLGPEGCNDCKDGWIDAEDDGCKDVNECEGDTNPCQKNEFCTNNEGSYTCTRCHEGCSSCTGTGSDKCIECAQNYYKDGEICKECHMSCVSSCTSGNPSDCDACKDGWTWNDEQGCLDNDECENNPCEDNTFCLNTPGSYKCASCDTSCDGCTAPGDESCLKCGEGYQKAEDGSCKDKDECHDQNTCGENEVCTNLKGTFTCDCKEGFIMKEGACIEKPKASTEKKKIKDRKPSKPSESYKGPADCSTCKEIVDRISKGIEATAKHNFGGGNTKWEEQKLGSYVYSETRLTEILEKVCSDLSSAKEKQCGHLLERYEDSLEDWWFKSFRNNKDKDLFFWLCIKTAEICCPPGTYGEKCKPCTGGVDRPCTGNGNCKGDSTREGSGECSCNSGYSGTACDQCEDNYYVVVKNDTHTICMACDPACGSDGCKGDGPSNCINCKDGYTQNEEQGCLDVDECAGTTPCRDEEHCVNNPGSYSCDKCDYSCKGCHGAGSDNCLECAERYFRDTADNRCKTCDRACKTGCTGPHREHCTGECRYGYIYTEGQGCQDVNECENGKHNCPEEKYCENTAGHFRCQKCDESCIGGCTGSGPDNCRDCTDGYVKDDNGVCTDIDECLKKSAQCDGEKKKCVNTQGSYICECEEGFIEKGEKCLKKKIKGQRHKNKEDDNRTEKEEL